MQRSLKQIIGYSVGATDGEIGQVCDFLFDDQTWTIRYMVVGTGKWLPGQKVLIAPTALKLADWSEHLLHVNQTKTQIEQSPPLDSDQPVSRQREAQRCHVYVWPAFCGPGNVGAGTTSETPVCPPDQTESDDPDLHKGDPHLRSAKEVIGYYVQTVDGHLGHIEDLILDDDRWKIRYVVIDTVNWWPGKKVVLAVDWVLGISWDTRQVRFDLSKHSLQNAPEYDPARPINREYEIVLYDYYGRPHYWVNEEEEREQETRPC